MKYLFYSTADRRQDEIWDYTVEKMDLPSRLGDGFE
jgi:hypothetical protein